MATIIAAHDISGVGRCSLVTALAVLPVMGHTCYPLPTAVLSHQTGLSGYSFLDLTANIPKYIEGWKGLNLSPDMIYTGFLGGGEQTLILADLIDEHSGALVVIDPVMGDNGKLYGCFDAGYVNDMLTLVRAADIIVPNATEFNLLCGIPPGRELPADYREMLELAAKIGAKRLKYIVITSADSGAGMCNLLVDMENRDVTKYPCRNNGISYNGTGDLFASVLCGHMASGGDIRKAVPAAADFVADCIALMPNGSDTRLGICYEPMLKNLAGGAKNEN